MRRPANKGKAIGQAVLRMIKERGPEALLHMADREWLWLEEHHPIAANLLREDAMKIGAEDAPAEPMRFSSILCEHTLHLGI